LGLGGISNKKKRKIQKKKDGHAFCPIRRPREQGGKESQKTLFPLWFKEKGDAGQYGWQRKEFSQSGSLNKKEKSRRLNGPGKDPETGHGGRREWYGGAETPRQGEWGKKEKKNWDGGLVTKGKRTGSQGKHCKIFLFMTRIRDLRLTMRGGRYLFW